MDIKQIFLGHWTAISIFGASLVFVGIYFFFKFIEDWSKRVTTGGVDKTFTLLLKQITVATFTFASGLALVIAGIETGTKNENFLSIALDGQTFSGLITLIIAVPAALASALVVIS